MLLASLMKLNKKYLPNTSQSNIKLIPDAYFPIFLPNYKKRTGKQISEFLFSSVQWALHSHHVGKQFQPLLIRNASMSGISEVLKGKSQLPLAAKLQRLFTHQKKLQSKEGNQISQFFALQNNPKEILFNLRSAPVQDFLQLLCEKGLIKRKEQLVYRDISSQTMVPSDAIEWREEKQLQLEVKCFVEAKHEVFPLVIDDPMLLFSNLGVVVHENDKRYKKYIGKKIIIPVINTSIPVFGEEGIDTIKDNGIQKLNPLIDQQTLEKTRAF